MKRIFSTLLFALCVPAGLVAQVASGIVTGRVSDASGAIVIGAVVELERPATKQIYRTATTSTGDYTFVNVPVGEYELRVSMKGFTTQVKSGIVVEVGGTYRVDATLAVGDVTETVRVEAVAPILRTETPEFGLVIDNSKIVNLPLNSRDILGSLSILTPGTAPARSNRLGSGLDVNVRGQRRSDNVLLVDGTMMSQGNAAVTYFINPDTVQEFEVKTGLYGAEYGIKPGGQFSVVTKSGTNSLHGTLYEFIRHNKLDARNFFDLGPRPHFRRNQFGGVVGGPVYIPKLIDGRNRLWFFFGYGGERIRQARPLTGIVPTADEKAGRFSRTITDPTTRQPFPNNTIPANRISPISQKFLDFWPAPNTTGRPFNYTSPNSVDRVNRDQYVAKIDFRLSDRSQWSARTLHDDSPIYINNILPFFYGFEPLSTWGQSITNTQMIGTRFVNEFGVHFYRRPFHQGWRISSPGFGETLGIRGFPAGPLDRNGVPVISVFGMVGLGDRDNNGPSNTGNWEVRNTSSLNTGSHSLKLGYHYRRHIEFYAFDRRSTFTFDQRYTGYGFADFLLGYPFTARKASEDLRGRLNQASHYFFVQDQWKATNRLTLSLGLRYEYRAPLRDQRGFNSNFNFDTGVFDPPLETRTRQPWETGRFEKNEPLIEWGNLAFLPRIGIAYRATQKWVVRTGFGIFTNEPPLGMFQDMGRNPRPGAGALLFSANATVPNITFADPFNTSVVTPGETTPTLTGFETPLKNTRVYNWGLSVQRELASDIVAEVGYQGSRTNNELTIVAANDATPGTGNRQARRPYPQWQAINFVRPMGWASYHGLETSIRKRPGRAGISFIGAYTWSKSLDTVGGRLGVPGDPGGISRNMTLQSNYGPGEANIPHRFVLNVGYELPFGAGKPFLNDGIGKAIFGGWSLNTILTRESGRYFTPVMAQDVLDTGSTTSQRPDVLRNPNLPPSERTPQRWFDTAAFARPTGRYGNAGRGIIEGPGLFNMDLSVLRNFSLTERARLEFRFEAFNFTNRPNFELPNGSFGSPTFGAIGTALEPRDLQFGLKLYW